MPITGAMESDHAARLERIAGALPGVVFELARSPEGELAVRYVGEGTQALLGVDPEALTDQFGPVLDAVHPDDVASLLESLEESAWTLSRWDWTGRAFAADGSLKYLHAVGAARTEPDGSTVWDGALLDETEVWWKHSLEGAMRRRLQLIVEQLPASSVVLYDRELRLCFCEGQLFSDLDTKTMLGRSLPDFVDEATLAQILPGIEAVLAGESAAPVLLEQDRHGRPLAVDFAPYRRADGRVDGAIVHWQDVSQLRAAQRARAEAEELLSRGFDDAPIGMALLSSDGRWLRVNQALCDTVGYAPDELTALTIADVTHPDDIESCRQLVQQVLAGERRTYQHEKRYIHRDGRVVWTKLSVSLARDENDNPLYLVAQVEDITERRLAERELARARSEIDRFFAVSPELMAIGNAEGHFVRTNPAFTTTLGYAPRELVGRAFLDFVHPEDREATRRTFSDQMHGEDGIAFENRYRSRDGSYRWLQWSATSLQDGFTYAVGRDITERREMEARLRESREQALSASRLKSEFVANMSHEIRTPLNGVVSMAELLLGTELSGEQREYAQVTAASAQALMAVIDDILDFSKIEAGKLEIVKDDYALEPVVADVCGIVGPKAREKRLELRYDLDPRVPSVLCGDASRVRQVLMNLVGNAIKFTSGGRVEVRVGLSARHDGSERLRVEVSDTGIGIDAQQLATLFQPFSQADATTTRRYGGTGLGLNIARQLVELMDGEIGVWSEPGDGSTFWFELPCHPGDEARMIGSARDLTGIRVLVVAADPAERITLEQQTSRWGMIPHGAHTAAEALELLGRAVDAGRPFELALITGSAALGDGSELDRAIEGSPRLRSTRRVRMVAAPAVADAGTLPTPVSPSQLYDGLVRALHAPAHSGVLAHSGESAEHEGAARSDIQTPRVLVAEDNEINQFVAVRMLQKLGYAVELAADGRRAIELSAVNRYAAVFMDCQMPEVDGYEATEAIRRREAAGGARTPIIAMTANTMAGDRERCLEAGMDDYLAKPLRFEQVALVCRRLIGDRQAGRAGASATAGAQAAEPFDPSVLGAIVSSAQAGELLELFLGQLDGTVPELVLALRAGGATAAHGMAHRLKGSAATIGAPAIAEICQDICARLRASDLEPAHPEGENLNALGARLQGAAALAASRIRAYLDELAPAA